MKRIVKATEPQKIPRSWIELAKASPEIFKIYGGGEAYLKKERAGWYK